MCEEKNFWPEGKTCALMLSVNLDAEFYGRIYYPDVDVDSGDICVSVKPEWNMGFQDC